MHCSFYSCNAAHLLQLLQLQCSSFVAAFTAAARSVHCSFYSCNAAHLLQLLWWRRGPLAAAKFRGSNMEHLPWLLRWRRGPPAAVTSHGGETLTHPHHPTLLPSRRRAMLPPKEVLAYRPTLRLQSLFTTFAYFVVLQCLSLPCNCIASCSSLASYLLTSSGPFALSQLMVIPSRQLLTSCLSNLQLFDGPLASLNSVDLRLFRLYCLLYSVINADVASLHLFAYLLFLVAFQRFFIALVSSRDKLLFIS